MATARVVVTASVDEDVAEYLDALRETGVEPVRIDGRAATVSLDRFDGLLVAGGVDVDPAAYQASPSDLIGETDPERDVLEVALIQAARERALPTLCICRGLQIANVAFGGTLIADVPHALGKRATIRHRARCADGRSERGLIEEHVVRILPDSLLARVVGTTDLVTGARHHQAVDRCARELAVVGRTDDGIVEALEPRFASPFWLAVQWHPESTRSLDGGASGAIFAAFAAAAAAQAFVR
ncbi:MAG TPA: gamma-glutamyl-gamma-aminobutyrate hydrolase family protein [Candidatus Sulfotelmatobacter sp.]|nr:gamma-glutamyl-gamma-aminobutyrate hydrolase family protein [Candidatus Sulfotelmatobacter sp.]